MRYAAIASLFAGLAGSVCAPAQWLHQTDAKIPRTKDGKPNLSAPAPRVHGKPDLSGIWTPESTPRKELAVMFPPGVGLLPGGENGLGEDDPNKHFLNILADFKPGEEPLTPAAGKRFLELLQGGKKPATLCELPSVPMTEMIPSPFKIVQTPGLMLLLYESDSVFRQIYYDGRKHPMDPDPSYMGYSVGKWEGDWFVVDVIGFNDRGVLDAMGHFHSDALHVTERFHRRDFGHMELQVTLEDPQTFTKPVTFRIDQRLLADTDVTESFCREYEKDLAHIPGK